MHLYIVISTLMISHLVSNCKTCLEKNRKKLQFLTSDITKAAYFNLMVDQGFVIRMESDGILLPRNAFNMVRKFWSGEAHSEGSISRGHAT